jgi:CheY-like chemotaxis protein
MKSILYIEDDANFAMAVTQDLLLPNGYSVKHRSLGMPALIEFVKRPNDYDVVLCDHDLPDMDGWEIVKKMREISQVPIVAFSALLMNNQRMIDYGATTRLEKVNKAEIVEILKGLLDDTAR